MKKETKPEHNCKNYDLAKGYKDLGGPSSCMGCKYNVAPEYYDGGCTYPTPYTFITDNLLAIDSPLISSR